MNRFNAPAEFPRLRRLARNYADRLTARGRFLLLALAALALVGVDTGRSQVFVLFACGFGVAIVSAIAAVSRRPHARLECALPSRATAHRAVEVHARVTSTRGLRRDLRLAFPPPLVASGRLRFEPAELFLAAKPETPTEVSVTMRPARRGRYELRGPLHSPTDPLRLATGPSVALPDQALVVYPRFYRMDVFPIPLGRRYQPGGIPLTSSTGDAIEFVGTREYREGDPLRNIHWRSWARRGVPVVKEYEEEYFCRIALILDTFLPTKPRPKDAVAFEASISVLASIADHFSRSEYVVDILAAGPDIYEVSAGRSLAYLENILDVLACLEPCADPPFASIGPVLFDRLSQITTVVAILQDWDAPRRDFLRRVKALGTAVQAIVVRDGPPGEPFAGAVDEIGPISQRTPADVEAAIAADASARETPRD